MKITVIGAGNVGATCAESIVRMELANQIVLLDIRDGFAEGKAMDMNQTSSLHGFHSKVIGVTNDYKATAGSKVIVVTSGLPRKPGMTREELIGTNAGIVKSVVSEALKESPDAVIVVISNPMDTMTYLAVKESGLPKNRIIGMGGILDSSRFKYYLSEAMSCPVSDMQGTVIGGHGDTTMIPLTRMASYQSTPVSNYLSKERLEEVKSSTMVGGATLTGLIGTSAWYAPGASGAALVASIINDQKRILTPLQAYKNGSDWLVIGRPITKGNIKKNIQTLIDHLNQ